jgi:hypothetical protein
MPEFEIKGISEICLQKNFRHFAKLLPKTFPALCQKCLQKLFQHFTKTASKNYDGILPNCLCLNIDGTFENCQ